MRDSDNVLGSMDGKFHHDNWSREAYTGKTRNRMFVIESGVLVTTQNKTSGITMAVSS